MEALVWARVPGDLILAVGVGAFALFFLQAFIRSTSRSGAMKMDAKAV
jgi:nitric oxide reductase large subunit